MRIKLRGAERLHVAAKDLRRAGGNVRKEMTTALRNAANPTLRKVKDAAATMTIRGFRTGRPHRFTAHLPGTHIRARVARVVELELSSSAANPHASFVVHNERLGNAKNMPFRLDTGRPFRHPLPGNNRHRWAAVSGEPWFYDNIKADPFEAEIREAIDRVIDQAEGKA